MSEDAGNEASPAAKSALRRQARTRVQAMSPAERVEADRRICGHLVGLEAELGPDVVLGYLALPDEARLDLFLANTVQKGRTVCLPRVRAGKIEHRPWRPSSILSRDDEGVLAPQETTRGGWPAATAAVLIVVPGRAFDGAGRRLGRGGGHYDRLLAATSGRRWVVGAGYECQILEGIPHEAHDQDMDFLVTETGWRHVGDVSTS